MKAFGCFLYGDIQTVVNLWLFYLHGIGIGDIVADPGVYQDVVNRVMGGLTAALVLEWTPHCQEVCVENENQHLEVPALQISEKKSAAMH